MKRVLMTFKNPCVLALYDKQLRLAGFQAIRTGMQTVMHEITALLAMVMRRPQTDPC